MSELWRDTLERLSAELEKINEAGNYRQGQNPAPRHRAPQRQKLLPAPQPRPVAGQRNQLSRILDAIPEPHQEYPPARRPEYPPARRPENLPARRPDNLPVRQNPYARRNYAHQDLQIEVLPAPREWRPAPIQAREVRNAREESNWGKVAAASFFGAVIGIGSYTLLFQGGAEKAVAAKAPAPVNAVASAGQRPRPPDGPSVRILNQPYRENVPSAGVGYGTQPYRGDGVMAQAAGPALLEHASDQLNQREAPRAQAPEAISQPRDDALLQQAYYKFNHGDVLAARAAYESAAERGSTLGAFGLAETYDPNVFARRRILGFKPDPGLARLWYERAAKLGSLEASKRLKQLTKPSQGMSSPKPISSATGISSGSEVLRR